MKNIDTTAKFSFKKTTVTVFNKQASAQGKHVSDDAGTTQQGTTTVIVTSYWTGLLAI